jgi:hypothetical protein
MLPCRLPGNRYQIDNGRIAASWHIEDNISLMQLLQARPPTS